MRRLDVHFSHARALGPALAMSGGHLAHRRIHPAFRFQFLHESTVMVVDGDQHVLPVLFGLVVHRHHALVHRDRRRRIRTAGGHQRRRKEERLVDASQHAPYDIHMRPARRWTGVLPGIWLAGLMTTAGQGIPPASPPGVTVSGLVATSDHAPLQSGAVLMNPVVGDTLASHPADDGRFLPDGSFSFRNVLPGEYQIRARAQTGGGPPLFAGYRIHVRDRDITDVRLLLRPGATVTGTVEVDAADSGARAPSFASLRVRAPFVDGSSFADALTGVVQKDGRFRLVGVMEGEHYFTLEGLTGPWVLQHVHWRGTDLTDAPLAA